MYHLSPMLDFAEHGLQAVALTFMALVYVARIAWLLHFKAGGDRQAPTGRPEATVTRGVLYSWATIAMPWSMESTRTKPFLYAQFVLFHLGVAAAIGLSFIIPYAPGFLAVGGVRIALAVLIGCAAVVGCLRIVRRAHNPYLRAISSPDDHFSLWLLTAWFVFAFLSVPNAPQRGEWPLFVYFVLTAFFLIYVPFSKISHYLYYPFTRYYLGKTLGHRGVYPLVRGRARG